MKNKLFKGFIDEVYKPMIKEIIQKKEQEQEINDYLDRLHKVNEMSKELYEENRRIR
jgi:hypothetical protein